MTKYTVIWGADFKHTTLSKSEAIKIAADVLNEYPTVKIVKE